MSGSTPSSSFAREYFNTLALSPTEKKEIWVKGTGSLITDRKALGKRTVKKMIALSISLALIDIAKKKGETELEKSFWNTYHCQNELYYSDDRVYGSYCKNRWCPLCNGNRSAEQIRKYLPVIETWKEPYLVTLTAKSVTASRLNWMVRAMLRAFKLIVDKYSTRHRRGKGKKLSGVRTMESNFNVKKGTYNIHFHLIVPDEETADIFLKEWLELWSRKNIAHHKYVSFKGQDKRPIWNKTKGLREVLKYSTKIFTPEDVIQKKLGKKTPHKVYARALYNIVCAFKGHQIFDTFGNCTVKEVKPKGGKTTKINMPAKLEYKPSKNNWVNSDNNKALSTYLPDPRLLFLLNNIDKDFE